LARGRRRAGVALIAASAAVLTLIAVLPIGAWMLAPLEHRFPAVTEPPARVDGIIVLGGAIQTELSHDSSRPALNDMAERMTEAVALMRRFPDARVIFTGGSGDLLIQDLKEAPVARQLWDSLGVDVSRIEFESESRNSWENALLSRERMHPQPGETWLLVTSAFHMPRAVGSFRQAGWRVVPYPVDYHISRRDLRRPGLALQDGLREVGLAFHEWLGLAAYRLMGRADSLWPGPCTPDGSCASAM
jgi:uncharacterized SAM-binding protein YcdF (DUF218 family)